ncbi:tripartite tricarboxylate transporter TctB family protein [Halomonas sp. SpR8]|uniref:tripartite tricarboxylate transporter TctB family protein n=1 Tax=Halomonas sp. SpR8 TaxID=3050463 RepID=UPI0027E3FB48|nr:tripartite tricarboxylate transporter TctB family protein [Halomonas sp. SpR8]MDQ7729650.1 tripartite tricarboxylate transporter TctB family protein [Halomonas sp. SpR8]
MSIESSDAETPEVAHKTLVIRKKWLELAVYFVLLAATALYANDALKLPNYSSSGIGASGFPLLVAMLIGVSLLFLIVVSFLSKANSESDSLVEISRPVQVLLSMMVMVAVVLALEWLGLIVGIALLAFLLMKLGGENRYSLLLTLPPLLALGIYAIFVLVLGVYFD